MPTILIVDDEESQRTLMRLVLKRQGIPSLEAANGLQGENMALELQPDLILLDVMMAEQDGYTTCANLRAKGYQGRIALVSAVSELEGRKMALQCGANEFLSKPILAANLMQFIKEGSNSQ
jgi:DNA-binding response OmpR family regulator